MKKRLKFNQQPQLLGEFLCHKSLISTHQRDQALQRQSQTGESLGICLVKAGWLSPSQLEQALAEYLLNQNQGRPLRLGHLLLKTKGIQAQALKSSLKQQTYHPGKRLGQILCEHKLTDSGTLFQALRLQRKMLLTVLLGGALVACSPPQVPLQIELKTELQIQSARSLSPLSGPFKTLQVKENQKQIRVYQNGSRIIENVPFYRQGADNTCGQAVIAMLASFWLEERLDYQALVDQENPLNLATTAGTLVQSLRKKGLNAQDFQKGSLENLISEINQGRPTAVLLDFGSLPQAHYVVVVGYNPKKNTLIVHDSVEGPYLEMDQQVFWQMWQNESLRNVLWVGGGNYQRLLFQVFG